MDREGGRDFNDSNKIRILGLGPVVRGSGARNVVSRSLNASVRQQRQHVREDTTNEPSVRNRIRIKYASASHSRDLEVDVEHVSSGQPDPDVQYTPDPIVHPSGLDDYEVDDVLSSFDGDEEEDSLGSDDDLLEDSVGKAASKGKGKSKGKKKGTKRRTDWLLTTGGLGEPVDGSVLPSFRGHIAHAMLTGESNGEIRRFQTRYVVKWRPVVMVNVSVHHANLKSA